MKIGCPILLNQQSSAPNTVHQIAQTFMVTTTHMVRNLTKFRLLVPTFFMFSTLLQMLHLPKLNGNRFRPRACRVET